MAYTTIMAAAARPGLLARFAARFRVATERTELARRARHARALGAMSDAELARLGIRRDRITAIAFGAYAAL